MCVYTMVFSERCGSPFYVGAKIEKKSRMQTDTSRGWELGKKGSLDRRGEEVGEAECGSKMI